MKKNLIAAALGLAMSMSQAEASLFDFSYTLTGGDVLTGRVDGTLQIDNNAVFVNSLIDFAIYNGVPGPSLPFVASLDSINFGTSGLAPTLTFNGGYMDFIACPDSLCLDGFLFAVGNRSAAGPFPSFPFYSSGLSFRAGFESFNAANWHLNPAQVPVPTTIWLLGAGFLGFFGMREKPSSSFA